MENTPTVPNNELEQRYIRYKDVIKELSAGSLYYKIIIIGRIRRKGE